jgi:hypothetical protein
MYSYNVDLNQFAKTDAISISAVRLANSLRPDDANIIPLLTIDFEDSEYTLVLEKINPVPIETSIPKTEADIEADENTMKAITGLSVYSTFRYDAMFYWNRSDQGVGNYIPEISLNPEHEIQRLKLGISDGTIT